MLLVAVTDLLLVNCREGGESFPVLFTCESSCNASDHQWQRCRSKVGLDISCVATLRSSREACIKTRLFFFLNSSSSLFPFLFCFNRTDWGGSLGVFFFFYQPAVTHCTLLFLCGCCIDTFKLCCFSRTCARRPAWVCTACAWATRQTTSRGAASFCPSSPVSSPSWAMPLSSGPSRAARSVAALTGTRDVCVHCVAGDDRRHVLFSCSFLKWLARILKQDLCRNDLN